MLRAGREIFASPKIACLSCHQALGQGGNVGPDLSTAGLCLKPEEIVESLLWPRRQVKEGFTAFTIATADGKLRQGYKLREIADRLEFRDPTSGERFAVAKSDIENMRADGSLMPEGLAESLSHDDRRDLVRFLLELGRPGGESAGAIIRHAHARAEFAFARAPLFPEQWPSWKLPVNRERIYDFYAKEAEHFLKQKGPLPLLPPFPGLDGGVAGHWGNQNEETWADGRWNQTDLGTVLCGIFRGAGATAPKGVCVRLGENGELAACFNPETLGYEAVWQRGLRSVFERAPRLDGGPDPYRHSGCSPGRPVPCGAIRLSRFLSPWQASHLLVPDRRYRIPRCSLGRERQVRAGACAGGQTSAGRRARAEARRSGRR